MPKKVEAQGSIGKTARQLGRSKSTVFNEIRRHNQEVLEVGECSKCRRAGCEYSKTLIMKNQKVVGIT